MKITLLILMIMHQLIASAQQTIPLYPGSIPGAKERQDEEKTTINDGVTIVAKISRPTLSIYLPEGKTNTGAAVIIFPGGGYWVNAISHEGHDVARYLAANGISAFVVKYRIPDTATMTNPSLGPLQDAQQAIAYVRTNHKKFKINNKCIGVLGFSAGGHLASTASTHYNKKLVKAKNLRPDFSVLIYPVISFEDSICHKGSREKLLGAHPAKEQLTYFSNELQVTRETPPAFLAHAKDDPVDYRNAIVYADALKRNGVQAEVLLFEKGGHGYGMVNKQSDVQWPDALLQWMRSMNFMH
jgi:acetyl esterase/lipase